VVKESDDPGIRINGQILINIYYLKGNEPSITNKFFFHFQIVEIKRYVTG